MSRSTIFLLELAASMRQELAGVAAVHARSDDSYCEVALSPMRSDACKFTIHSEEDTEMTIEFGEFSVAHVYSADFSDLAVELERIVKALVAGQVRETVGFVNDKPCRAKAEVGEGKTTLKFSTRDGLCIGGTTRTFKYSPYRE